MSRISDVVLWVLRGVIEIDASAPRLCRNHDFANLVCDFGLKTKVIRPVFESRYSLAAKNLAFEGRDCPCEARCLAFGSHNIAFLCPEEAFYRGFPLYTVVWDR